jgi:hypothetical protein
VASRRLEMAWNWKKMNSAKRSLIRRGALALVAYEVVFAAVMFGVDRTKPANTTLLLIAILPTLTVLGFIAVLARYLGEEVDEFHRQLVVRCLLWGTAAVMATVCFHGFLQLFGWMGKWPAAVEVVVFVAAMGAAKLTYKVKYRVPENADLLEGAR